MKKLLILLLIISCSKEVNRIVAKVNGIEIYDNEVNLRIRESGVSAEILSKNSPLYKKLFAEKLKESIESALITSSYPQLITQFTNEEIEKELFKGQSEKEIKKFLKEEGIDFHLWKEIHRRDVIASLILKKVIHISLKDKENKKTFEHKPPEEDVETPYIKFQQIVTKDRKIAEKVMNRIRKGEDFEKLAEEFSIAPERGKIIGPFFPGELPSEFDICFKLNKGDVSSVVKSPYGYHIFKLVDKGVGKRTFFRPEIVKEIAIEQKLNEAYTKLIKDLTNKSQIEIYIN